MTANPIPIRGGESDYLAELRDEGIAASLTTSVTDMRRGQDYEGVDLALVDTTRMADATVKACILEYTRLKIPTIALVPEHGVGMFDPSLPFADVMVVPARPGEIILRARRLLSSLPEKDESVVRAGDLSINHTNYEVSVGGRSVNLRFKEYELLLLMATNPGRVYTREQLLERIWGLRLPRRDPHGRRPHQAAPQQDRGPRPPVHRDIRSRSVWNVGYKFKRTPRSGW